MTYKYPVRTPPPAWQEQDPPPFVTTAMPRPEGVQEPRAVLKLAKGATMLGWAVRIGYSRGYVRAVRVGTYKLIECWGVWAPMAHGWRWYAINTVWHGATWSRITAWRPGEPRLQDLTVTDLYRKLEEWSS
jgi:hypothetical protein